MHSDVKRLLMRATTVADLIAELEAMPPEAVVVYGTDYGDYCHTEQALPIGNITLLADDEDTLKESAYSKSGVAIRGDKDVDEDSYDESGNRIDNDFPPVVVLRM